MAGQPAARGQFFPSDEPNLSVTAARQGAAQVLQVRGEVDATSAWRIDGAVMGALRAEVLHGPVIVDLSGVTLFSAAGITALVTARKLCDGLTDLRIVAASPPVMRLLEATALSGGLTVYPTLDRALIGSA
ncbi:MAG TPA: STAS domain-containing protein [Streptosporangiaceae bacterium]|nr:STAS domain-containing protein [Streptosporangiaceae bacterium]